MRFTVETWAPDYGTPIDPDMDESATAVDVAVELPPGEWEPIDSHAEAAAEVVFVDGVRRVDANVWIEATAEIPPVHGVCASYAAGAVRCTDVAEICSVLVERSLFTPAPGAEEIDTAHGRYGVEPTVGSTAEELWLGIQRRMGILEGRVAAGLRSEGMVVVDGPLSHHQQVPGAVGYVKTQLVHHLPEDLRWILRRIPVGRRTPIFLMGGARQVFSWYLRLATAGSVMSGIVRCEVGASGPVAAAIHTADRVTATLPRFASQEHKDPRAPQNLYPIGGLERELRHRLGDPAIMERALRRAAS